MNTSVSCFIKESVWRWKEIALGFELTTCLFAVVGCVISLCCLKTSGKIELVMKIQFTFIFAGTIVTCLVALPGHVILEYLKFRCLPVNGKLLKTFLALYTISAFIERNAFAVLAIFRFWAVCFPFKYKQFTRWTAVVGAEVALFVLITLLWLIDFITRGYSIQEMTNPSKDGMGQILYYSLLLVPQAVTAMAYSAVVSCMLYRKFCVTQRQGADDRDQVVKSVSILILMNLLLDVPHVANHLTKASSTDLSYILIHVIYRLHFALDPFIFVGLNAHFRQQVLRYVSSKLLRRKKVHASQTINANAHSRTQSDTAQPA
ncbi:hypothetical protein C7M84_016531 [Penaeus vannamei]|uniref:G-protein coupled receptors family 1 profile domain-containing protein n=1 Tax=Penaeus vannamei TaxID=6689 RepID=A0A423SMS7_PENVA|nr:uncharacterized protein LOC113820066 [Penaeus vannamei]ROT65500.1 hypothetical protein C7M84_016531 [Penaeus vannamei]